MATALPGVANTFGATMVAIADGSPITAGTVNFYLLALSGANAGKWFRNSDDTWQAAEVVAQAGTHKARGHWQAAIHAAAWVEGVTYRLYAEESGGLSVAYGYEIACEVSQDQAIGRAALGVSRVWFVSATGNNANSGESWAAAKLTIAGVTGDGGFADNQGILFGAGTWTVALGADLSAYSGLAIAGAGMRRTIITSAVGGSTLHIGPQTRLSDLSILNTSAAEISATYRALGLADDAVECVIENCFLDATKGHGLFANVGCHHLRIRRCIIQGGECGLEVVGAALDDPVLDLLIEDTYIESAGWTACLSAGFLVYAAKGLHVRNCRILGSIPDGCVGDLVIGADIAACVETLIEGCTIRATDLGLTDWCANGILWEMGSDGAILNSSVRATGKAGTVDLAVDASVLRVGNVDYAAAAVSGTVLGYVAPGADILADTNELQSLGVKLSAQGKADLDQEVGRRNAMTMAWFVDTENGDDGDDGLSWGTAKETISGAAAEGDFGLPGTTQIVYVAGEPTESVDLVDAVSIQGGGGIWRFTAAVYNIRLGTGGAVRGFLLERAAVAGEIVTATGDCVVEDCTLTATGGCKAVLGVASKVITLRRCVIKGALDATVGTIVVDQCRRESGSDTGNVVYTSDIASRAVPGDVQVTVDEQEVHIGP